MKGDIHIHSKYSPDSMLEPEEIVRVAQRSGLDFIAISDHNRFKEHNLGFHTIKAEEVSSIDGHILAIFIDGEITPRLSQAETVEMIHDRNGIAICAHPFRRVNGVRSKFIDIYDAIEDKNGRCSAACNKKASELAAKLKRPVTAGSDSHFYEEIGRTYIELDATDDESIRKAILNNKVKTNGKDLSPSDQVKLYLKLGNDYVKRGFKRI